MFNEKNLMKELPSKIQLKEKVEVLEKELIIKAMKSNNWVIARTARQLNVPDRILTFKLDKYQIQGVLKDI
jgi:transcriptional regulator with GAF, ATPase, and Fis domain